MLQYVDELTLLTMSDMERCVYDMTSIWTPMEQRQICCHLQVIERLRNITSDDLVPLNLVKDAVISFCKQVAS